MKQVFSKASPAERAALVRMVSASIRVAVVIGRAIKEGSAYLSSQFDAASEEFVAAIIGVQESEEEAVRESYR